MATMILLPDNTSLITTGWGLVGESSAHECLDDDNDGTSYIKSSTDGDRVVIEYANPSVAVKSIESVRFISSGKAVHRTDPSLLLISFNAPGSGFAETASYDAHRTNYETINGTARTTSDGSNAWTYANLEDLEMRLDKSGTIELYLSYLALEVTYTPAEDNAIFFGTNF